MLKSYKELKVWKKSYDLCLEIYKITAKFPNKEIYDLTSQIRRAAVSIPSNIAEGYGTRTTTDYVRKLHISYGFVFGLETQILLAGDLLMIAEDELSELKKELTELERMLKALIKSLEKHLPA